MNALLSIFIFCIGFTASCNSGDKIECDAFAIGCADLCDCNCTVTDCGCDCCPGCLACVMGTGTDTDCCDCLFPKWDGCNYTFY